MIRRLVEASVDSPRLVVGLVLALAAIAGVYAVRLELDALPDLTNNQVLVLASAQFAKCAGRKRAADALRYELSNIGGDVDTVFLRSR